MASAINGAVPATNSDLTSAVIRTQFGTAASEITTLQNQVIPLQTSVGTLQTNVGTLQTTVTGLQTTAAPLASPSLTGTPTAPTAVAGTNTTQLATTAFVAAAVAGSGGGITQPQADARYLQLTGGTIRNPGATTTLNIAADAGSYETLLGFPHAGAPTNWDIGVGTAGNFRIRDTVGSPPIRFDITPTGLVQIARSVAVGTGLADMGIGTVNATAYYQNGTLFTGGPGGGLPLTGGTLRDPALPANTPTLIISAISTDQARISYQIDTVVNRWSTGMSPGGDFFISDAAASPAYRLDISSTGWARINGSLTVGNALIDTGAGTVNAAAYYQNGTLLAVGLSTSGGTLANSSGPTIMTLDNAPGTNVPQMQFRSSSNTLAAPTATVSNTQLGMIQWLGHDGSAYGGGANIQAQSAAGVTWTPSNRPARLIFQTTRTGNGLPSQAMYIGLNGGLVVGSPSGGDCGPGTINAQSLYTDGTLYIQGMSLEDYIKQVVGI